MFFALRWVRRLVSAAVVLVLLAVAPSALVLSTVTPGVIKLRLRSLEQTGQTVGRLSAAGTLGALAGTFLTGYVLLAALPGAAEDGGLFWALLVQRTTIVVLFVTLILTRGQRFTRPEAFAAPCALVSGRHLTWYGPSLVEARALLLQQLRG